MHLIFYRCFINAAMNKIANVDNQIFIIKHPWSSTVLSFANNKLLYENQ